MIGHPMGRLKPITSPMGLTTRSWTMPCRELTNYDHWGGPISESSQWKKLIKRKLLGDSCYRLQLSCCNMGFTSLCCLLDMHLGVCNPRRSQIAPFHPFIISCKLRGMPSQPELARYSKGPLADS